MNTEGKKYYKQVKKQIPILTKKRKDLLDILQYSLDSYSQSHEDSTYSDYINNFGTPDEYVNTLLEEAGINNLKQSIRSKNALLLFVGIGIILLLAVLFMWGYILHDTAVKGYIDIIIETSLEEETINSELETTIAIDP